MKPTIKNHLYSYISIVCIIILYSCSGNTNSDKFIIDVKSAIGKGAIYNASDFINKIEYIPLETGPNSMVGSIIKIIVENNRIYISDNQGKISIFSMEGRHLNTLTRQGRGPKEYIRLTDYTVSSSGSIFILSNMDGIVEYNNKLEFVNKILFKSESGSFRDITLLKEGLFASNVYDLKSFDFGYKQALTIYDDSLDVKTSYSTDVISINPYSIRTAPYKHYRYNGDLVIYRMVSDTISSIGPDNNYSKSVKYILDYGSYSFTEETLKTVDDYIETNSISLNTLLETDNYLFITFDFMNLAPESFYRGESKSIYDRNSYVYSIYNKTTGKLSLLNQSTPGSLGLKDDLTQGPSFWPKYISQKQELITFYNSVDLIILAEQGKIDKTIITNLKEDDNPVVVIATPK
jgi:hypothetical protein